MVPASRAFFASCTRQEALRVASYRTLEAELRELGAPSALLRACRRAAEDEGRHAALLGALAGTRVPIPLVVRRVRSTFEVARENARLGLVRSTYSAVVARAQVLRATAPSVRETMRAVATDEMEHADLAVHVDAFLRTLLSPHERCEIDRAFAREVELLSQELEQDPAPALITECGLPDARLARDLLARLRARVWVPAFERLAA